MRALRIRISRVPRTSSRRVFSTPVTPLGFHGKHATFPLAMQGERTGLTRRRVAHSARVPRRQRRLTQNDASKYRQFLKSARKERTAAAIFFIRRLRLLQG